MTKEQLEAIQNDRLQFIEDFKMKYPYIVKIVYVGNQDNLPVFINDSTHNIQSANDIDIACDLLNVFSEIVWNEDKFCALIAAGKYIGEFEEITAIVI